MMRREQRGEAVNADEASLAWRSPSACVPPPPSFHGRLFFHRWGSGGREGAQSSVAQSLTGPQTLTHPFILMKRELRPSEMVCSISHSPKHKLFNLTILSCF